MTFKEWLSDQVHFDIEVAYNWFIAFDILYWQFGIFHGPNSIEVAIGPFSITKQYDYE
jgi:hypothetical protein